MPRSSAPTQRPRVMQCITRLGLGGAERVAFALIRELGDTVDSAVFTVHGADRDAIGTEMLARLRTTKTPLFTGTRIPMKCGGMLPGGIALAQAVRKFRPDILHFHSETPEACGAIARIMSRQHTHAVVRTIHNSVYWRYWPRIGRWCDRQLAHAHIAGVSHAALEEFLRYRADSGAPPPPSSPGVIYNGVGLPALPPRVEPRSSMQRRVLFAGRFEYQKGTDVLSRAIPQTILPRGTNGILTLLGHGADEPLLRALAASPPPSWKIEIRRPVAALDQTLGEFDLVVVPSRFEGLGLVAIEATLCGLPVVTTDAPGLREVLPPEYPWRARPGDPQSLANALGTAFAEISRWTGAVSAAQQFARVRFSPAAMRDGYLGLYVRAAGQADST